MKVGKLVWVYTQNSRLWGIIAEYDGKMAVVDFAEGGYTSAPISHLEAASVKSIAQFDRIVHDYSEAASAGRVRCLRAAVNRKLRIIALARRNGLAVKSRF